MTVPFIGTTATFPEVFLGRSKIRSPRESCSPVHADLPLDGGWSLAYDLAWKRQCDGPASGDPSWRRTPAMHLEAILKPPRIHPRTFRPRQNPES